MMMIGSRKLREQVERKRRAQAMEELRFKRAEALMAKRNAEERTRLLKEQKAQVGGWWWY
jgi:hypothetical protein